MNTSFMLWVVFSYGLTSIAVTIFAAWMVRKISAIGSSVHDILEILREAK
jgi:hypothetical protein